MIFRIIGFIVIQNLLIFASYGIDKHLARRGGRRISEKHLILSAFLMGGVGALLGMKVFRHKTQKPKFRICIPAAVIINLIVMIPLFKFLLS